MRYKCTQTGCPFPCILETEYEFMPMGCPYMGTGQKWKEKYFKPIWVEVEE